MRQRLRAVRAQQGTDGGFTLTELLIVIVILGVLTGIVVFAVGAFTDRGEEAACLADRKAVEAALEAYRAKEDAYPPATAAGMDELVTKQYLRGLPPTDNYTISLEAAGTNVNVVGDLEGGVVTKDCSG
jgi:prepilin-type N-terminal cleavage/methylation domain-containing protein